MSSATRWRTCIGAPALVLACGCAPSSGPPNLVLITVDTLRADHLQTYGYFRPTSPAIDALARQSLVFDNAIAPMATTLPTHTSLMTSTYPARHGILSNLRFFQVPVTTTDELRTAAQMLLAAGYSTAAFTSSSPLSRDSGINAGFEVFRGPPPWADGRGRIDIPAAETIGRALRWLDRAEPPFFLWVHLFDPHDPYSPPPPYDSKFEDEPKLRQWLAEHRLPPKLMERAVAAVNLYDGEILYADTQIARLLERIEDRGFDDDSVIVFAADHGEGLYQHGVMGHGWIWNEQIRVPLMIRFPDRRHGRLEGLASLIDVLPTVAEEAGLPLDTRQFDGVDLLRRQRVAALSQRELRQDGPMSRENYALTTREWKYLYFANGTDRLFRLNEDAHETRDVIRLHPEIAERMKAETLRLVAENARRTPLRILEEIPEHVRQQLEALGYVE